LIITKANRLFTFIPHILPELTFYVLFYRSYFFSKCRLCHKPFLHHSKIFQISLHSCAYTSKWILPDVKRKDMFFAFSLPPVAFDHASTGLRDPQLNLDTFGSVHFEFRLKNEE